MKYDKKFNKLKKYIIGKYISIIITSIVFVSLLLFYSIYNIYLQIQQEKLLSFYWAVAVMFSIICYVLSLLNFVFRDPINRLDKYSLRELLEYGTLLKTKGIFTKVIYREILSYISSKNEKIMCINSYINYKEKLVSDTFYRVFKNNKEIKLMDKQVEFKVLCEKCVDLLDSEDKNDKSELELEKNKIINEFNKTNISVPQGYIILMLAYMKKNIILIVHYISLIAIVVGVYFTKKGRTPLDTWFYALASFITIIFTIISIHLQKRK